MFIFWQNSNPWLKITALFSLLTWVGGRNGQLSTKIHAPLTQCRVILGKELKPGTTFLTNHLGLHLLHQHLSMNLCDLFLPINCEQKKCLFPMFQNTGIKKPVCTSHQSEWLSLKSLQTINAGEGVEKRKPSYTVGGNVNWYNHYGEQYGGSLKH